ncbi:MULTISPECIES: metallophosphoesterase family protein [unclassified Spirosoma]|uniref:purple acid phosphatase family protein n=1 Tax=unclassified Spirosoma TaxID=2621999 RepID=UPI000969D080|nr:MULTISPECIES: metallophosphoesterase family protein [unclassified Spirosoma]MBN8826675.1 metallophosphoesterase family protein [Spirosoma sp.]OJW75041.1 MAG: metallophosphoesterase [Spirosoma sp. 48-14]
MKHLLCTAFLVAITASGWAQVHKEYTPTAYPDRLILGWQGNAATSQSVNWRTDSTVTNAVGAIAESDPSPDFVSKAAVIQATTDRIVLDGKTVLYHSVHFTNLKPATKYTYRVGDGVHWSEWFQFKTAQNQVAPFSFLYFGDAQNDIRSLWSRAIRGAYSMLPAVSLMIHAGDLITTSNADWQWAEWFEAGGWINGMVPTLATPGNHEYFKDEQGNYRVSRHWRPSFVLPENGPKGLEETAYFFDYQGVRFVSLNSQAALLDSTVMTTQANWLVQVLSSNPNRWTIVTHHHPIYSTKQGRDNDDWRKKMEPIYKKYGVDLVLQGHDHTYGRGLNMPLGKSRKHPDGPIYVVSVSGPKMYDIGLQNWMDRAASNTQLYQTISVDGAKLSYQSYTVTGEKYDSFDLLKDNKGKNTLVDQAPVLSPERLELPAEYQKRYTPAQMDEYRNRFQEYKARKQAKKE